MAIASAHRSRRTTLLFAALAAVGVLTAPPAVAAPAPEEPPAVDTGVEGTRAALVRIEITAVTTIAHINHSTGELVIHQSTYEVPQGQATGVLVGADGIVATLWRELSVDLDRVTVPAANQLFVEQIGAQLVDGSQSRGPTHATDPDLDMHLQHCYQRVLHCIVTADLQYDVVLLTEEPQRVRAVPVGGQGSAPTDVALLRVGGSSTPSAPLSSGDVPAEATLAGFDAGVPQDPAGWAPATVPVQVTDGTVSAAADQDLRNRLNAGLTGGPLLDPATGEVAGLVDWDRTGDGGTVVGAAAIREALDRAEVGTARSPFDVAFARGLDLLNDGRYGAAAQRLEAASAYFDSALAVRHQQEAAALAGTEADTEPAAAAEDNGTPWWLWAAVAGGVLVLLLLGWWLWRRSRRRGGGAGSPAVPGPAADGRPRDEEPVRLLHGPPSVPPPWPTPPAPPAAEGVGAHRREAPPRGAAPLGAPPPGTAGPSGGASVAVAPAPVRAGEPSRPPAPPGSAAPGLAPPVPSAAGRPAFCIQCGEAVPAHGRYCGACGSPVPR